MVSSRSIRHRATLALCPPERVEMGLSTSSPNSRNLARSFLTSPLRSLPVTCRSCSSAVSFMSRRSWFWE